MVFAGANPGKRDVTLDLDQAEGMDLLWRLLDGGRRGDRELHAAASPTASA